ncbi:hypothetical protein [Mycolicibacterium fortuitum]|uniref:hypothetical protein n=1 Tax=Mycolicibacterium fortuitum TaxID=1766 RepID=UPI00262794D0|nr:hypothetical protein [Mycolicibacterium fortuitum]
MRDPSDPYADERQATGPTAHELWEAQQARANRATAIQACTLCDPDGYRGTQVCDHTDRTETHRRGIELVREALEGRKHA